MSVQQSSVYKVKSMAELTQP